VDPDQAIPFEDVLRPFVLAGRQRLGTRAGAAVNQLTDAARGTLERSLLQRLSRVAASPLDLEFSLFRHARQSSLARLLAPNEDSRELYDAFVARMLTGEWTAFLREYSVLERLTATLTDFWADAVAEFLLRLDADRADLQAAFSAGAGLGRVVAIDAGLSDPHNGGRTVLGVRFESGLRLVYKPRDVGIDDAYFALLAWLNDHGAPLPFACLRVVSRPGYGWIEFAEQRPCADAGEAGRYFTRAGMLLALLHALGGTDFHHENIVASGEYPVAVDVETLLPFRIDPPASTAPAVAHLQLRNSVLATGLLPQWSIGSEGRCYETSGLGGIDTGQSPHRWPAFERPNTDGMQLGLAHTRVRAARNAVVLDGSTLTAHDYAGPIGRGFGDMYRLLLQHREALLHADGPFARLRDQRVRFIARPTALYMRLLASSLDARNLRDDGRHTLAFGALDRILAHHPPDERLRALCRREQEALERLDIPCFSAPAHGVDLPLDGGETLAGFFPEPAIDAAIARVRRLSEEDLDRQEALIRAALYARAARGSDWPAEEAAGAASAELEESPLSPDDLRQHAIAIADDLQRQAIRARDGSITWIGLHRLAAADRFDLQPVGPNLYDGACGIALFFAALARAGAGTHGRDLASSALQPLRQDLRDNPSRLADPIGIGGGAGLGSIVYALTRIGGWLEDDSLIEDAARAAALITPERLAAEASTDVLSGSAGAILGLLALNEATDDASVLERARACGRHMLERRANGRRLAGFSHGAAGMAYALLRLHAVSPDAALAEGASEAVAFERRVYDPDARNWPDLRRSTATGKPAFRTSWCHGAPGIALARLGGLAAADTPRLREDIEIALQTTHNARRSGLDQLCCGDLGRADVLLTGSSVLSRRDLFDAAQRLARAVVRGAERRGGFRLLPGLPAGVQHPGFFQGTAGIGYALLRLSDPDRLPSVLLWE
jgi:type 2 lantibiotic biosynthesis protein LanM